MQLVIYSGCRHAALVFRSEWHGVVFGDTSMTGHLGFLLFTVETVVASPISNHGGCFFFPSPSDGAVLQIEKRKKLYTWSTDWRKKIK